MTSKPKTITTYLIDGNPNGLRTIFISNKNCKALVVPRASMDKIKDRNEALQPAVYFLLNENENKVYIGESENFYKRLSKHNKVFWDLGIIFFSQNNEITKADVKYLEYLSLTEIKKIDNISLEENNQIPACPNLPEHQKSSMDEFFEDVRLITGFIGYNFFALIDKNANQEFYYCKRNGTDAKGIYDKNQFMVLEGSKISAKEASHYRAKPYDRQAILDNQQLEKISDNFLITKKDLTFSSPSAASSFCVGKASNGWTDWKNKKGKTLDEVIRKQLEK